MANNPPVLVDAATGRPLLSAHDAERDVLLATIAKLRKSNLDLLDMRNAATRENDAWREWAGDVGGCPDWNGHDEELRTLVMARMNEKDVAMRGSIGARDAALAEVRKDCACLQEALDDSEHKRIRVRMLEDRASIVAFLAAEAKRFDEAARGISAEASYSAAVAHMHERLVTRASLCRTLAAQIERGDDRNGGDAEPRATPEDLRTAYHAGMGLGMRAAKPTEREQIIAVIASMLERGML